MDEPADDGELPEDAVIDPAEPPAEPPAERRARRWLRRMAIGALALVALLVIILITPLRGPASRAASKAILFASRPFAPDIGGFDRLPASSTILAADGSPIATVNPNVARDLVKLDQVPPHVVKAVLAAEDADFYGHSGVQPSAVFRAALTTITRGDVSGGSTITQQLAKLNYTGSKRTFGRKFREVLYASELERKFTKEELLERYLNQVYFGDTAYGIGAASRVYFGTTPDKLTPAQGALLAGKIRSPVSLDPGKAPDKVLGRRNDVLDAMQRHGWLDDAALAAAKAEPVRIAPPSAVDAGYAPHFVQYVRREAETLDALGSTPEARGAALDQGGYTIRTTLDRRAFDAAAAAAQKHLGEPGDPTTAVVSVQPGDGAIRVLFGGLDPALQFDVASQGQRQPGSAFKPFVYLAAVEDRIDPRTPYPTTSPITVPCPNGPFEVNNYEGKGGPPADLDAATADSINVVFAQLVSKTGPKAVLEQAKKTGIPPGIKPVCAIALGGTTPGVSPLNMASAYAVFASGGVYAAPYAIATIDAPGGNVVHRKKVETREALDKTRVGVLNNALVRVVTEGTGKAASIGRPVAGKTGTTQDYGDAWFVGFVPQLATAVWVGHPDKVVPMTDVHGIAVAGGTFPARIFAQTMRAALEGVPAEPIFTANPDVLGLKPPTTTTAPPPPPPPPPPGPLPPGPTPTTPTTAKTNKPTTSTSSTTTTTSPQAPRDLRATQAQDETAVDLKWSEPASGPQPVRYRISRGTSPGALMPIAETPDDKAEYRDATVQPGVRYYYAVAAIRQNGSESPRSNEVTIIVS